MNKDTPKMFSRRSETRADIRNCGSFIREPWWNGSYRCQGQGEDPALNSIKEVSQITS